MNILIIEDDTRLAHSISSTFINNKFANRIDILHTFHDFLNIRGITFYDIILLDICLWEDNKYSWIEILQHIRRHHKNVPIIMISSHSEYIYLEEAFRKGAHDYIIKPFRNRELQIRIQRWFRNYIFSEYFSTKKILNYYEMTYDISSCIFYYRNQEIRLTRSNKYMLLLFLVHRESLLSHEFLTWKIWWYSEDDNSKNLRIKILRLKRQLENIWLHDWIQVIRWEWYMLKKYQN